MFGLFFFFFNDTATTEIYTLSLHDALPTCPARGSRPVDERPGGPRAPSPDRAGAGEGSRTREGSRPARRPLPPATRPRRGPRGPRQAGRTRAARGRDAAAVPPRAPIVSRRAQRATARPDSRR